MWNFKSITDDDPMKFGFGSPATKDKKKKAFKLNWVKIILLICLVHSRKLPFPFSLSYLAMKLIRLSVLESLPKKEQMQFLMNLM
ncbi:hypothetical protein Bca4012_083660 [Brassica carinata]